MKKISLALIVLVTIASCKKNDVEEKTATPSSTEVTSSTTKPSSWKTIASTSANNFDASISDKNITTDVTNQGLVLVFAKSNRIQLLPAQLDKAFVYYQVSEGAIQISAASALSGNTEFSYIIFSSQRLKALEQNGISKTQLMKMSYADVSALKN